MSFTRLSQVLSLATCAFFFAGAAAPEQVLTETSVAMLIVLWLSFPFLVGIGLIRQSLEKSSGDNDTNDDNSGD